MSVPVSRMTRTEALPPKGPKCPGDSWDVLGGSESIVLTLLRRARRLSVERGCKKGARVGRASEGLTFSPS